MAWRKTKIILQIVVIFSITSSLLGQEVDYGPKHISPTLEVITPHIKWLKPYANGPLNVLFLTHRGAMREIVELAERMDINYTVISIARPNTFYERDPCNPSTLSPESMTTDGERKLEGNYDVIVIGNIDWNCLPLSWRYLILRKVKDGTNLLGMIRGKDEYLTKALEKKIEIDFPFLFPYKGLPHFEKYEDINSFLNHTLDVYQFGEGRIFLLKGYDVPYKMQMLTPSPIGNPLEVSYIEYDYYLAFICHLLTLCARKEPTVKIMGSDFLEVNRDELSKLNFSLESKEKGEITCKLTIRDKANSYVHSQTKEVPISPGENKLTFDIEKLPAGEYFADLWVLDGGKTIDFGSSFIKVHSDIFIKRIEIKRAYNKEETISGKVILEGRNSNWKGFSLLIYQKDNFGRITSVKDIDLSSFPSKSPLEVPFSLPKSKPLTILQNIWAVLLKGKEALDCKRAYFTISNLYPEDDIRYILWVGAFGSYLTPLFYRELYKQGFDTQYTGFNEAVLLGGLYHLPYATRFIDRKTDWYPHPDVPNRTKEDHIRLPCLNDPSYLEEVRNTLTRTAEYLKQFSTKEFSMGDECHFVGGSYELCFCPYCVSGFAKFLEKEYGNIENLNREYVSNYKSFSDVKPVTLEEVKKDSRLVPLWVDYRRYMEDVWAGIYKFSRDVIEKVVPGAKVGYEGSDMAVNSFIAADFYKLMQAMNLNNTYDAPFIPYAVSHFSQPATLLGLGWYGGYNPCRSEIYNRYIAWRHLFRGANSFWVWHGEPGEEGSVVAPDLSFYDFFKANAE
ncbi:MAG: beta-galactosidase, partial [bacterium]